MTKYKLPSRLAVTPHGSESVPGFVSLVTSRCSLCCPSALYSLIHDRQGDAAMMSPFAGLIATPAGAIPTPINFSHTHGPSKSCLCLAAANVASDSASMIYKEGNIKISNMLIIILFTMFTVHMYSDRDYQNCSCKVDLASLDLTSIVCENYLTCI